MILVVLTHSLNIYQLEGERWIQFLWVFIMTFTMPLFTMISGYWYKEKSMKQICILYLFPCVVFSIVNYCIGGISGAYPKGISFKSGWAMWYLWALFLYQLSTPFFLKHISLNRLMLLSFMVSIIAGFKFVTNDILDVQRVIGFYPFYLVGIWLNGLEKDLINLPSSIIKICEQINSKLLFFMTILLYLLLTYLFPGFCYGSGFMSSHGMSLFGFASRLMSYILNFALCFFLIAIMPDRKLWFSKYGTRTMNVYLLHMSIVFPVCWYIMRPYMHEWYGYLIYMIIVPLACCLLFSEKVDQLMKLFLNMPNKLISQ